MGKAGNEKDGGQRGVLRKKRRAEPRRRWGERGGMGAVEMGKRNGRKRRRAGVSVNNEGGEE